MDPTNARTDVAGARRSSISLVGIVLIVLGAVGFVWLGFAARDLLDLSRNPLMSSDNHMAASAQLIAAGVILFGFIQGFIGYQSMRLVEKTEDRIQARLDRYGEQIRQDSIELHDTIQRAQCAQHQKLEKFETNIESLGSEIRTRVSEHVESLVHSRFHRSFEEIARGADRQISEHLNKDFYGPLAELHIALESVLHMLGQELLWKRHAWCLQIRNLVARLVGAEEVTHNGEGVGVGDEAHSAKIKELADLENLLYHTELRLRKVVCPEGKVYEDGLRQIREYLDSYEKYGVLDHIATYLRTTLSHANLRLDHELQVQELLDEIKRIKEEKKARR